MVRPVHNSDPLGRPTQFCVVPAASKIVRGGLFGVPDRMVCFVPSQVFTRVCTPTRQFFWTCWTKGYSFISSLFRKILGKIYQRLDLISHPSSPQRGRSPVSPGRVDEYGSGDYKSFEPDSRPLEGKEYEPRVPTPPDSPPLSGSWVTTGDEDSLP